MQDEIWTRMVTEREDQWLQTCLKLDLTKIQTARDLPSELLLYQDATLRIYYAPFGLLPPKKAKILIVGLTPGFQQARKSYENFQAAGGELKRFESLMIGNVVYAGSTRQCLSSYLDELGIAEALNIPSAASLFHAHSDLLMPCSLLRYPIFVGQGLRNYGGTDSIHKRPIIQSMIHEIFLPFLQQQDPGALIVPMGKYPALALRELALKDPKLEARTLFGFPHTSGSNGHRRRQFLAGQAGFREKIRAWAQASPN